MDDGTRLHFVVKVGSGNEAMVTCVETGDVKFMSFLRYVRFVWEVLKNGDEIEVLD